MHRDAVLLFVFHSQNHAANIDTFFTMKINKTKKRIYKPSLAVWRDGGCYMGGPNTTGPTANSNNSKLSYFDVSFVLIHIILSF